LTKLDNIQFYIIYLPNTVRYLTPMVQSLLKWSNFSFCLVANGCAFEEQKELQIFTQTNSRLSFLSLPFKKIIRHGEALNFLFQKSESSVFAFMDSDIFASGVFLPSLMEALNKNDGVFSGRPLWASKKEGILPKDSPMVFGRYHHTTNGLCLGNTYFALYHKAALKEAFDSGLVDFRIAFEKHLTSSQRQFLMEQKLERSYYDTGKLLNIHLLNQGKQFAYLDLPNLHHLGGFTRFSKMQQPSISQKVQIAMEKIRNGKFNMFLVLMVNWFPIERFLLLKKWLSKLKLVKQSSVERYFSEWIVALVEKKPLPKHLPIGNAKTLKEVEMVTKELAKLYKNEY